MPCVNLPPIQSALRVAVNSTHGQLDTCVELLIYKKVNSTQVNSTQESTRHTVHSTQLETYVNLKAYTQQFNCSALGICSRRKANILEDRLNRKAKVVCTCIFCWSCLPMRRFSLTCMSCHLSQEICSRPAADQVDARRHSSPLTLGPCTKQSWASRSCQLRDAAIASFNLLSFRHSRFGTI